MLIGMKRASAEDVRWLTENGNRGFVRRGMDPEYVLGDDVLGEEAVQAAIATLSKASAASALGMQRPAWRNKLGPGVPVPGRKNYPLTFVPDRNNGVFTNVVTNIIFTARPQKAWRGERLVVIRGNVGAGAPGVLPIGQIFNGTDLLQANVSAGVPLDIFASGAFDTSMIWGESEPGIDLSINVTLQGALAAGETITLSISCLGSIQA